MKIRHFILLRLNKRKCTGKKNKNQNLFFKIYSCRARTMSIATKRKHVFQELDDMSLPTDLQTIVRIVAARGHHLYEVITADGDQYLVSMPTKFRQNIFVKRGDYIVIEPIKEGKKVKGEIVKILTKVIL